MIIQSVFFVLSVTLTLLFFLYGFNHYYLLYAAHRYVPPILEDSLEDLPPVSIHLPIYNEKYVVRRLMAACTQMAQAYGIDKVNILILDDSDDETASEVDAVVEEYIKKLFHIEIVRRHNRLGYKAGALQAALEKTPEEFIAIFDADFTPPVEFLLRTVPYFIQDEHIGIVQGRWGHLNRDFNIITNATAIGIDIHFLIEQTGRFAAGLFQNFNGSAGVIRKKAILEAGGWQADTLAEDLDLSYRMQILGYRILYLKDLLSPGEIPPTIPSFKKQQGRWANGTLRTAKKTLPIIFSRREIKFKQRLQAFIHMTGYFLHPLMTFSFLLSCMATFFNLNGHVRPAASSSAAVMRLLSLQDLTWLFLGPLILLCTIAPWITAMTTLREQKLSFFQNLPSLLVLLILGYGISLNNTLEAGKALLSNRNWEFTRTPKYADLPSKAGWQSKRYQISLDGMWGVELAFACTGILAIAMAARQMNWPILVILVPITFAYASVSLLTILQSRRKKVSPHGRSG
jgi:cellulose synthase/poly-beta-1,6-N-acetylglucosamine synthase-like glycosyltransferase